MRLLNTSSLSFEEFYGDQISPYAILSHRWEEEEVSLQDMQSGRGPKRKGYAKIERCCRLARSHGYKYAWVDTCCIDKTSSAELTEAINSMFRWYQCADKCYAFLSDVSSSQMNSSSAQKEFSSSAWFTRGWTLQELIAPRRVMFFNRSWEYLGSKSSLRLLISKITSIDPDVLIGEVSLSECAVAQRMSWAAKRTTTRLEDRAYSLLGIFNVNMPMLYGEGERSFQRLQEEIIKHSDDHSLFAWNDRKVAKSALAPSPSCFASFGDLARIFPTNDTSQGFTLKNAGLSISLQLVPWSMNTYLAPLRCGYIGAGDSTSSRSSFRGYDRACIFLQQTDHKDQFIRVSVKGKDLVVLTGDHVAEMRDKFGFSDTQVLIHQLSTESYIRPVDAGFYGFVFSFQHNSMFAKGRRPRGPDVVCAHKWDSQKPVLELLNGRHHTAGMFRIYTGHYMYFGFDRDFGPLCLITTRNPRSRRFTLLESDLQTLSSADVLKLLDLNWLRGQIEEGTASGHAIIAFKGERRTRTEVECSSLSLRLVFEWRFSALTNMQSWHVEFNQLERIKTRDGSASPGEVTDTVRGVSTSPLGPARVTATPRSPSRKGDRLEDTRNYSEPQASPGTPPRIKVVDHDKDNNVRIVRDVSCSHAVTRPGGQTPVTRARSPNTRFETLWGTVDDNDVRVIKAPDRPSGLVIRGTNAKGITIITQEEPSMFPPGQRPVQRAAARTPSPRAGRLIADDRDADDRRRPRSR